MTTGVIPVDAEKVPSGRSRNPFNEPIKDIATKLMAAPGQWFIIGTSSYDERSKLNNAASLLRNSRYRTLREAYLSGMFETRVSGAKDAPHSEEFEVAAYARFIPKAE